VALGFGMYGRVPGRFAGPSSRPISQSADALEGALFRGTSEGWSGSASTIARGITPTTTNPAIAHLFAAESATHGSAGSILIARTDDLAGVELVQGNVLRDIEREVGVQLLPSEFASRASMSLTLEQSQMILRERGIEVPLRIHGKDQLNRFVHEAPVMTPLDVTLYLRRAMEMTQWEGVSVSLVYITPFLKRVFCLWTEDVLKVP
jgi:hypothetical protein